MNFDNLKLEHIGHTIQIVIFNREGDLIDTCNSIIKFDPGTNLFEHVVFLESIKSELQNLTIENQLDYHCISNPFGNDYAYDFSFELDKEAQIIWYLSNYTSQYNQVRDIQQSRNDGAIIKEKLNKLNKKLSIEKELIAEQSGSSKDAKKSNIFVKVDSLLVNFELEDICIAEAYGDYVKLLDRNNKHHVVYTTLKKVEDKLPKDDFIRVHRSYIVRMDAIENVDNSNMLVNDRVVPISKKYRTNFMDILNTL